MEIKNNKTKSQRAVFLPIFSHLVPPSVIIDILIFNHLKNNSKIFVEIFCQFKKKLYFCTRFRKGSEFIKIDQKIFLKKDLVVSKKRLYLCTRFQNERAQRKRLKIFFEKDLVNWKKGCTFAPAKMASEKNETERNF